MTNEDMVLVRDYGSHRSEAAFETLVARHINLVYSAAVRRVGDPHLAEEVTQAVFILLARKAGSLGPKTILPSWLHRTACHVAADALKTQRRRERREQEAHMQSHLNEPEAGDSAWLQIAPLLDEAIANLGEQDRHAVVLRFFQNKSFGEVGAALGASEDAAKMRVNRALEKLRKLFSKRGVTLTAAAIAGAVSANALQAVPVGLAAKISVAGLVTGTITTTTIATMNWLNAKAIAAIVASGLAAGITTYMVQHQAVESLRTENAALREQADRLAETEGLRMAIERLAAPVEAEVSPPESERLELLRLRGQVGPLRQEVATLTALNKERTASADRYATVAKAKELASETIYTLRMIGWANRVYANDHNDMMPTSFDQLKPILRPEFNPRLELGRFEFVDHGHAVSEAEANLALVRERTATQLPDGRWARCYLYVDGGAYQRVSDDGNFDRFEKL